jgi:hypothetical protein
MSIVFLTNHPPRDLLRHDQWLSFAYALAATETTQVRLIFVGKASDALMQHLTNTGSKNNELNTYVARLMAWELYDITDCLLLLPPDAKKPLTPLGVRIAQDLEIQQHLRHAEHVITP